MAFDDDAPAATPAIDPRLFSVVVVAAPETRGIGGDLFPAAPALLPPLMLLLMLLMLLPTLLPILLSPEAEKFHPGPDTIDPRLEPPPVSFIPPS